MPVGSQVLTFSLTVAGTERITLLQRGSLQWVDVAGSQVDTLRFTIEDVTNSFTAAEWQAVIFKIDGVAQFGGYVVKAQPTLVANGNHRAWTLTCESYATRLGRAPLIRDTWTNTTTKAIIAAACTAAGLTEFDTSTYVATGPTLTTFTANGEKLASLLERLKALASEDAGTDWEWQIRADKKLYFRAASADVAPFGLALVTTADWSSDFPVLGLPALSRDASLIYNRITVRGGTAPSAEITDTFTGNGSTVLFTLTTQPIRDIVRITVAGTLQSHGVDWYDSFGGSYDVLVNYSAGTIRFPDASPPAGGAALVVVYRNDTAVVATAQSNASYTQYGNLWFDKEVTDASITALADAQNLADALLEQYAFGSVSGTATVERFGIRAGQQVAVNFAALGLVGDYPVRKVTMSLAPGEFGIRAVVNFGGQNDSLSAAVGGGDGEAAASAPIVQGEVGIVRVRNRMELIDPTTHFTSAGDYGNATGWVGLYDSATRTGKWLGLNSGALQSYLDSDGKIKASGVTIDALGIAVTQGSIVVGSTNKLWLNDATDGALNIGGSVKASAPFRVSATGALTATGVTITGALTAGVGSVVDGTYLSPGTVAASKLIITAGGANLLLNSTMQIDLANDGVPDTWIVYSASETGVLAQIDTGGVDNRAFARVSWTGTNSGNKGITSGLDSTVGGVQGGWLANTTYIVSFWAKTSGMTGAPSGPSLTWNTAPTTTTWITQPVISAAWQRYAARIAWGASVEPNGRLYIYMYGAITGNVEFDHVQVEQADTPSAWKPYPSELEPGSVTADKIYVASLAAIEVDTGALNMSGFLTIGAAGGIYQGTYQAGHDGDAAWPETGLKIWRDGDIGRLATYNTHVAQVYFGTDGKLYAGAGNVVLDANGITSVSHTAYEAKRSFKFEGGGAVAAELYNYYDSANYTMLKTLARTGKSSYLDLFANSPANYAANMTLRTQETGYNVAEIALNSIVSGHAAKIYYTADFHTFSGPIIPSSHIRPAADSTTALQLQNASGTAIVTVDTTNARLGVGATPGEKLHVSGTAASGGTITARIENLSGGTTASPNYIRLLMTGSGGYEKAAIRTTEESSSRYESILTFLVNAGASSTDLQERLRIDPAEVVVNEGAANVDFRAETDSGYNGIYIDASNDAANIMYNGGGKLGFYGATPITCAVLATGASLTVDNVISALQALGLVKQS